MKQRTRYLVALGLGFVVYRIAIAVTPTTVGLVIALVLGAGTAFGVWSLTAPKRKDDQAGTLSRR